MLLRIVAEGMNAYYNRDPIALRALLQRIEEQRLCMSPRDVLLLEQVINDWVRKTQQGAADEPTHSL